MAQSVHQQEYDTADVQETERRRLSIKRIRVFASIILFGNAFFLVGYTSFLKPRLLAWAAGQPDIIDAVYYTGIFRNLELPALSALILAAIVTGIAPRIVQWVERISRAEHWLLWTLGIVVVIQVCIVLVVDTTPHSDSIFYTEQAHRLASTGTYTTESGEPTAFWPVGYPAILSAVEFMTGGSALGVRLFHIIVYVLLIVTLYAVFRKAGIPPAVLVLFIILYALHPNGLFSVNAILTEFPFMLLLWLGLYYAWSDASSWKTTVFSGVMFALAAYMKPLVLGLVLLIVCMMLWERRTKQQMMHAGVFVAVFLLVLLPWTIRNAIQFHALVPVSTNGGVNFYIGNNPHASGKYEPVFLPVQKGLNEAQRSNAALNAGLAYCARHPWETIKRIPRKLLYAIWRGDASVTWSLKTTRHSVSPLLKSFVFYYANLMHYIMLAGLAIALWYRRWFLPRGTFLRRAGMVFLYFVFVVVIFFGSERFMAPIMPLLCIMVPLWLMGIDRTNSAFGAGKNDMLFQRPS